jgi:hypothetical protein
MRTLPDFNKRFDEILFDSNLTTDKLRNGKPTHRRAEKFDAGASLAGRDAETRHYRDGNSGEVGCGQNRRFQHAGAHTGTDKKMK